MKFAVTKKMKSFYESINNNKLVYGQSRKGILEYGEIETIPTILNNGLVKSSSIVIPDLIENLYAAVITRFRIKSGMTNYP